MSEENHEDTRDELLELAEAGNESEIRDRVRDLHPADAAAVIESLPLEPRRVVWEQLDPAIIGDTIAELSEGVREDLLEGMDHQALVEAVRDLDADEIADLIPDLPDDVIADVLFAVDRAVRQRLDAVLSYPEDTAGGIMDVDALPVRAEIRLAVVLRYLRLRNELPEHTDKLFVIDNRNRLVGELPVSTLLTRDPSDLVRDHMDSSPIKFNAMTTDDDVAAAFERYNLVSAPVVDDDDVLIGRITVDDVVDVIREEADRSMMVRAGLSEEEDIFAPVARTTRARALWLGVNLITAVVASWVIGQFEATIERIVALAVLMPIIASMGGNAGTQTLTIVIRGLSTGTVTRANAIRVLRKELLVGGLNGVIWALAVAVVATVWYRDPMLGAIVASAMVINLVASALAGVGLPILLQRLGIDPALASGVALTTVTDVVGFFAVLGLATVVLL